MVKKAAPSPVPAEKSDTKPLLTKPPEPIEKPSSGPAPWFFLSLRQWRQSEPRVEWLRALLRDMTFREFMGMLHYESKTRDKMPVTELSVALEFGRTEGRADILGWIEAASQSLTNLEGGTDHIDLNYGIDKDMPVEDEPL